MRSGHECTPTSPPPERGGTTHTPLDPRSASRKAGLFGWDVRDGVLRGVLLAFLAFLMACAHPIAPAAVGGPPPGQPSARANAGLASQATTVDAVAAEGGAALQGRERFEVSGEPLAEGVVVGAAAVIDNLTVFPILAAEQPDFGQLTSLDAALANGTAEVREAGAGGAVAPAVDQQQARQQVQQQTEWDEPVQQQRAQSLQQVSHPGGGDRVNTLVVDNKGELPIYILAGTVVKGGRQDRQIGQDVIIPPKSVVPVDAFCVEQGRWNAQRQGRSTGGKFRTLSQLANSKVRAAAQYEGKQGKVWEKVAEVNQAHQKSSSSGTLLATLDAPDLQQARNDVRQRILAHLDQATPSGAVVGLAYAVDGKVQGVRWFANRQILGLFRDALANTAAVDAITARASGSPKRGATVSPLDVRSFIDDADREASAEQAKQTAGDNENRYSESEKSFQSKTTFGKAGKPKRVISNDYLAK